MLQSAENFKVDLRLYAPLTFRTNVRVFYRDEESVRMYIKMLLALSFVPVTDVPQAFDELVETSPPQLATINDYWEDNFVGRQREPQI
jgi:hypothetical protein